MFKQMILKKIFNITSILSRISLFVHQKVRKIFFEGQIFILQKAFPFTAVI